MNFSLFHKTQRKPLADEVRPDSLEEVFGQEHIFNKESVLSKMIKNKRLSSLILWGPPGCGKTTIAKIIAKTCDLSFESISAAMHGTVDLKRIFEQAELRAESGNGTIVLIDEIHRFNKTQQDVLLPYLENGIIILIGATTENPSFSLNSALLSRCKVLTLKRLSDEAMFSIIKRTEKQKNITLPITSDSYQYLYHLADGDGRYLLNLCEEIISITTDSLLTPADLSKHLHKRQPIHDNARDMYYNLRSALFKSIRGSDCNAALYWLARMLEAGEDPLAITRHLIRQASEDIGLADPNALTQALAAKQAYEFLGSPEGDLAVVQAVIYLATAPKSNSVYKAYKLSVDTAKLHGSVLPPKQILNAPNKFMKEQNYSKGYIYDHDTPQGFSGQNYFPEELDNAAKDFYHPAERGFEREILKRIQYWQSLKTSKK
ncbi:MAG: replication-associated recombination protein A [Rickettsiales bacterium]|nr:replication-associated recombination protein A [Rickettsiales bacterium]